MQRGAFITIEGGEGVGKSSSLATIESCLRAHGIETLLTREPGGTPLGEKIRHWILEGEHGRLSAEVESLLMFAARAAHLEERIQPALARGAWIICDRFTDSTLAYQGGGRGADQALLNSLVAGVQKGFTPDLTLLLDAPVVVGMTRIAGRPHDHFEREHRDFFERVRSRYLELAAAEPERFRIIDAAASQAVVQKAVEDEIAAFRVRFSTQTESG